MKPSTHYTLLALALLVTEILIAIFVKDAFIRPFFGDFLAVLLVYTALMIFGYQRPLLMAIFSLLIAYTIEILQYLRFVEVAGLSRYRFFVVLIGTCFSWLDILAYTAGFGFVLWTEKQYFRRWFLG